MLRETLKHEIDQLSDSQLAKIADFINSIKTQAIPIWQSATPIERAEDFRAWVAQLPETNIPLDDAAFDRSIIYYINS
ncbi:hypothetical protein Pse7367_0825 [Thalassoporum mexicanum PCC 7367]|uniref:hypothetical protein n=1 Tax=Thalassoporum mexicanum TaxID=3457544 RepID=UPI00029FF13A|nr:hypothetical protein [Pseudanabaena sp. PCC 7367]AFY69125.1 hypothetical protein Pse7367_0825 [Pseudanabaena sp. PCC 7367]